MSIIVQKYGGSSLADAKCIKRVAQNIAASYDQKNQIVAVVSAMGNTTDHLVDLASQVTASPTPRELDFLLSTGEIVSSSLVSMALHSLGYQAVSLSGGQAGILTNTAYSRAQIIGLDPQRILDELNKAHIVVVAGFQGITEQMETTTMGRGASDLTAVALAAALQAQQCEIYTDVEGIYTADPRLVPKAQKLSEIGFEEMMELASYGAKMQPRSVELAAAYNIPLLVRSSFVNAPGTLIHGGATMEIRNKVRGIAAERDIAKITVLGIPDRPGIAASLFEPLAQEGISVDTIVQNSSVERLTDLTFTVHSADLDMALKVIEPVAKEIGSKGFDGTSNLAKVSIVGGGMQNTPGYAATMFRTLFEQGINIELITTAEIRITCIISQENVPTATQALHTAFNLDEGL